MSRAALALKHRGMTIRLIEICHDLRTGPPLDEALPLMEEWVSIVWQFGFPISPPDHEAQESLADMGWLLRPFHDPVPDPPLETPA